MTSRPPNDIEKKLLQTALTTTTHEITPNHCEAVVPDAAVRVDALNYLLSVGLLKALKSSQGTITAFRAVSQDEYQLTQSLNAEEKMVLGLWTKHIKAKTNLHQIAIDRCLKSLLQKHLIKRVPSVQHHTRRIYMLSNLEPSVALTGGPWYTDNELDTEFIRLLRASCLQFIRGKSYPRGRCEGTRLLFPISSPPGYPTSTDVQSFVRKSRISTTDLSVEHVEMLLDVLVVDGQIEKIPSFGTLTWSVYSLDDPQDEDDDGQQSLEKRKRKFEDEEECGGSVPRKRMKTVNSNVDHRGALGDHDDVIDTSTSSKQRPSTRAKGKRAVTTTLSEVDSIPSLSEATAVTTADVDWGDVELGPHVYRAVSGERFSFGCSQAPCVRCPTFTFCREGGPVNPRDCIYYDAWSTAVP
ncbi:RNA polymerase Rpc34 subunit-domain-containing protein [Sparassis latifolia]